MSVFPRTSVTLIARLRELGPGRDSTEWVRFWDSYSLAIRQFAAIKGGEENADDIVMTVLAKLVEVLRSGQYTPEKGRFHSYLATMIVNEVHMAHRKNLARGGDRKVSLDATVSSNDGETEGSIADTLVAPDDRSLENLDADWRNAILKSAVEHVLTKTALSDRDRAVYRAYALEGRPIEVVASEFKLPRNSVSQIKTRIDKRIVAVGKELVANFENERG